MGCSNAPVRRTLMVLLRSLLKILGTAASIIMHCKHEPQMARRGCLTPVEPYCGEAFTFGHCRESVQSMKARTVYGAGRALEWGY